ncbi:MAG TPA: dTDP-glucose 4,6-dehydratase [Ktedonobacterales bacterium]|jgi:dTDP-glucose 4,6-dehydratase|nr:dTDP-glucose 4,6-dehydratase [Ktedonobacterales bacterium]
MGTSKTVLVTGGAGFIGSNFVQRVLTAHPDWRVVVLDKLTYAGNRESLAPVAGDPRLRFIQGDICDRAAVLAAMSGCDWVVNFAAETHVDRSIVDPSAFVRTDVEGTYTLLEAAREVGIERFVQISTDEVYGNAEAPDGSSRPSLETDALKPLSPYAASKAGADRLAYSYWATYGLPVVVTRCSNNYGPYQYPEKQLPLFIVNALHDRQLPVYGNGANTRDWIHASDHCAALEAILTAPAEKVLGEVFNVGAAEERSILENARLILDVLGKPHDLIRFVPDRLGHVRRHAVDSTKLRDTLGWEARVRCAEGLPATVAWYQANRQWLSTVLARQDSFLSGALALAETSTVRS